MVCCRFTRAIPAFGAVCALVLVLGCGPSVRGSSPSREPQTQRCSIQSPPALDSVTGGAAEIEGELAEVILHPLIQVATVTLRRGCDVAFTQLVLDGRVAPAASAAAYGRIRDQMLFYDSQAETYHWIKAENGRSRPARSQVRARVRVQCAPGAVHHSVTAQDVFSIALSPQALRRPAIAPLDGYCTLEEFQIQGAPRLYTCDRPDYACPGNSPEP